MPNSYVDIAIKRQALLERLKSSEVRNFALELRKIDVLVRMTILSIDTEVSSLPRARLGELLKKLESDQGAIFQQATSAFLERSADIAALHVSQEIIDLENTVDVRGTKLNDFTNKEIFSRVMRRPLATDGDLLEPWLRRFSDTETRRVSNAVRQGHSQGVTNQDLVRRIVGTKANNFKDGLTQTTRRNASTVVRTSVQHVASSARQEVWEANKDVVKRYQFLATLDRSTSRICRTLDNQEFEFGEGPIPPVHPNCRSTTIPILDDKFSFLSKGRTRSGEQGPVDADQSYYDWLNGQDEATQIEVLGESRAKLFRDGGLTAEQFRELQFDKNFVPLTLPQMQEIEPEAFRRAGILQTPNSTTSTPARDTRPTVFAELEEAGHEFGDTSYLSRLVEQPQIEFGENSFYATGPNGGRLVIGANTRRYAPEKRTLQTVTAHEHGHAIHQQHGWITYRGDTHPRVKEGFDQATQEVRGNRDFYAQLIGSHKGKVARTRNAGTAYRELKASLVANPKFRNLTEAQITESIGGIADTLGAITNNLIGWGHSDKYYRDRNFGDKKGHNMEFFAHAIENRHGYNEIFEEIAPELFNIMTSMIDDLYSTL